MKKLWLGAGAAAIAAVIALLMVLPGDSAETGTVKLRVLERTVRVKPPEAKAFTEATSGATVAPRTDFATDATGLGQLDFWDGSVSRIGPSTQYSLDALSRDGGDRAVAGRLDIGKTWHNVKKVTTSGSRYEVKTSNAVAAVRGTKFAVICLVRDVCTVKVLEGSVLITGENGDVVLVGAGQEVTIDEDGNLSPLRPITDDPWIEQNVELDELQGSVEPGGDVDADVDGDGDEDATTTTSTGVGGADSASGGSGGAGPGGSGPPTGGGGNPSPGSPPPNTPGQGPPSDVPRGGDNTTTSTSSPSTTSTSRPGYPPRPPGP